MFSIILYLSNLLLSTVLCNNLTKLTRFLQWVGMDRWVLENMCGHVLNDALTICVVEWSAWSIFGVSTSKAEATKRYISLCCSLQVPCEEFGNQCWWFCWQGTSAWELAGRHSHQILVLILTVFVIVIWTIRSCITDHFSCRSSQFDHQNGGGHFFFLAFGRTPPPPTLGLGWVEGGHEKVKFNSCYQPVTSSFLLIGPPTYTSLVHSSSNFDNPRAIPFLGLIVDLMRLHFKVQLEISWKVVCTTCWY